MTGGERPLIGGRYEMGQPIGVFGDGSVCDHPSGTRFPGGCTCIVCARCGRHTGNGTQGHYWSWCKATKAMREFHLCCPDNCELEARS